jgi:hypothetical protein
MEKSQLSSGAFAQDMASHETLWGLWWACLLT